MLPEFTNTFNIKHGSKYINFQLIVFQLTQDLKKSSSTDFSVNLSTILTAFLCGSNLSSRISATSLYLPEEEEGEDEKNKEVIKLL